MSATAIEAIEFYGFKFDRVKYCCGGTKNLIYKNGIFELKYQPRATVFKIKRQGQAITNWAKIDQLDNKLRAIYEFKEFFSKPDHTKAIS